MYKGAHHVGAIHAHGLVEEGVVDTRVVGRDPSQRIVQIGQGEGVPGSAIVPRCLILHHPALWRRGVGREDAVRLHDAEGRESAVQAHEAVEQRLWLHAAEYRPVRPCQVDPAVKEGAQQGERRHVDGDEGREDGVRRRVDDMRIPPRVQDGPLGMQQWYAGDDGEHVEVAVVARQLNATHESDDAQGRGYAGPPRYEG